MNGELVDWADAKVHVGAHGLHYGSGVFEGIRCYETESGPAVFRLTDHLERLHRSAGAPAHGDSALRRGAAHGDPRAHRRERALGLLHPPDRVLRLRRARRPPGDEPGRCRPHDLALGRVPRRGRPGEGHPREGLLVEARRAEHDPARLQGDGHLPQLDARGDRGHPRRLRRGDPAHRRRSGRGRLGREHLRRQGRDHHQRRTSRSPSCRASRARPSWRSRRRSATPSRSGG